MPTTTNSHNEKAIFAAYLNMAKHNVFIIINHIHQKLGVAPLEKENELSKESFWENLLQGQVPEKNLLAIQFLAKYFSFVHANHAPNLLSAFFKTVAKRMDEERNNYTHFYHDKATRTSIGLPAETATDKVAPTTQSDESNERPPIQNLADAVALAKHLLLKKIKNGVELEAQRLADGEQSKLVETQLYRTFTEEDYNSLKALDFPLYESDKLHFTDIGLAFFTTMFVEKKFAAQFLQKIPFLKEYPNEKIGRLYKEWIWMLCCRLPQPKLESSEVSMDILNELYRAPRPLYNFLSEADKKRFEVDFHYEDSDAMEEMGNQVSILKRKKDRFPHLAMRVMDKMKLFDQLRFQVSLGKWLRKEGEPSTNIEDRKIYERLRAFGRLDYFVPQNAPKDWQAIPPENSVEDTENPAPWHLPTIEQFSPQYQISGNRIALKVLTTNKPANWHKRSSFIPYPEKNKTMQRAKAMLFQADAILSTYELGALFFYQYLHKVKKTEDGQPWIADSAEKFIKDYIQRYQRFAQAVKSGDITPIETADFEKKIRRPFEPTSVKNTYTSKEFDELEDRKDKLQLAIDGYGYDLNVKDLPDAMREYLLGYQHDEGNSLKLKLIQRKKDTEKRLRQLRRAIEKIIEKEGTIPLSLSNQVLANFLAEDIMKWRPKDQKLARFADRNAKKLGQLLIEFPHKKRDLEDLIYGGTKKIKRPRSMRLIDINYPFAHPFLNKVNPLDRKDLRDFYQQYLIQKKQWINRMLQPTGKKVPKPDAYFRKKMAQPERDIILKMELTAADTALQKVTDFLDHQTSFIGTATTIQNGELATYLADDLVFLKPKNMGKGVKNYDKPNNQEYKRLQSMLAMYSMDKIGLVDFMETLGLMGKGKPHTHPFLHLAKPAACTGIKTFYEAYLQAKIKWLDGLIENFKKEQQSITKHFGSFSRKPPKEINYAAMPMRLPRGLFNDAIQTALVKHTDLAIAEEDNFNRCIQKYLANDHQPFYDWYRTYEMEGVDDLPWKDDVEEWTEDIKSIKKEITSLEKKRASAGKRKPPLSEKEATRLRNSRRLKRKAQTNEQRIRYAQHTDRLLLLLLQELTTNKNAQQAFFINFKAIKLADIQPEDRNQKSQAIPAEEKVGQNTGNLLAKPIVMEITVGDKKVVDVLSIKRHGEFRRFFKDRRLENLLKYYGDTTSQKAVLQDLLTYWQSMDTPTQEAMLIYLKSTPVQREKFKAETSVQADWVLFDDKWRDLTIHHFDKDTFEVEHLATLFNYLDNETVLRRHLLRELTYYDDNRDKIFEKIIAFEQAVHTQLGTAFQAALDKKTKNAHFLDHTSILKLVKNEILKDKLSPDVMKELRLFRNKLAHNQLYYSPMLNGLLKGNSQTIVKDLMRYIEKTYEWLTQEVNGYTA